MKDVQGACSQSLIDKGAEDFGAEIVEVAFQDGDGVDLPVVGGSRLCVAEDGAQDVGTGLVFARAQAVADFGGGKVLHWSEAFDAFSQQGRAGGSY